MISKARLRSAARIRAGSVAQDGYLKDLELAAVAFLGSASGRYYGPPDPGYVQNSMGHGSRELILEEPPNDAPTVVEHQLPGDAGAAIVAGDSDGYLVRGRTLVRKAGLVWTAGYEYAVTFSRGYASGQEPAVARQFVTGLVVYWFERRTPMPKAGETHTFDLPFHLQSKLGTLSRHLV